MNRFSFIKLLSSSLVNVPMSNSLKELANFTKSLENTSKMPVLFLGHGSPMNAIEDNEFVREFKRLGKELQTPNAILCISAHWETSGTYVTAMQNPKTIHDFGGFPQALFDVEYPAPGNPELAKDIKDMIDSPIHLDDKWGLDHGSWSVIKHLYPEANIPVLQLSLDYNKPPQYHYELAQELQQLRNKGVLIVGSGNIVHNLRMVAWDKLSKPYGYDWAIDVNEKISNFILEGDIKSLINYNKLGKAFDLAIPTPEHYLPLLYTLGLKDKKDEPFLFNNQPIGGSLSMTSLKLG